MGGAASKAARRYPSAKPAVSDAARVERVYPPAAVGAAEMEVPVAEVAATGETPLRGPVVRSTPSTSSFWCRPSPNESEVWLARSRQRHFGQKVYHCSVCADAAAPEEARQQDDGAQSPPDMPGGDEGRWDPDSPQTHVLDRLAGAITNRDAGVQPQQVRCC